MKIKLCKRCFTMKNIKGKKIICKRCEEEFDKELHRKEDIKLQDEVLKAIK